MIVDQSFTQDSLLKFKESKGTLLSLVYAVCLLSRSYKWAVVFRFEISRANRIFES